MASWQLSLGSVPTTWLLPLRFLPAIAAAQVGPRRPSVFQPDDSPSSLFTLVGARAALRRQQLALQSALRAVQQELRDWDPERRSRGPRAPSELRLVWAELEERERELVLDLLRVEDERQTADAEIQRHLLAPLLAS